MKLKDYTAVMIWVAMVAGGIGKEERIGKGGNLNTYQNVLCKIIKKSLIEKVLITKIRDILNPVLPHPNLIISPKTLEMEMDTLTGKCVRE